MSRNEDLQNDVACIVYDLDHTISLCEFTDIQSQVLRLYREDKTQQDIADILKISQQMVNSYINAIFNKIANKNLELYEDWYYLNICKGEYKKCSKCNEIKLVSRFDKNGRQGYMSMCKKCRKK